MGAGRIGGAGGCNTQQVSAAAIMSMYNSPAVGAGRKASSAGSSPVAGVMRTPELNQVSQMMSSLNTGAGGMHGGHPGMQVRVHKAAGGWAGVCRLVVRMCCCFGAGAVRVGAV